MQIFLIKPINNHLFSSFYVLYTSQFFSTHELVTVGVRNVGLKQLGVDRVINYREEDVNQILKQEYPQGINLVFECVGKQLFDTCVDNLAIKGRLIVVGSISEYSQNPEQVLQPRIYHKLMWKAASVRGFLNPLYQEYVKEAQNRLLDLFYSNRIKVAVDSTKFEGIESISSAVEHLLNRKNCGKVVVEF